MLPGSPVKEFNSKLSPFREKIYSDLKGKIIKNSKVLVGIKDN